MWEDPSGIHPKVKIEPTSEVEQLDAGKQINPCCLRLEPERFHVTVFYSISGVLSIRNQYRFVFSPVKKVYWERMEGYLTDNSGGAEFAWMWGLCHECSCWHSLGTGGVDVLRQTVNIVLSPLEKSTRLMSQLQFSISRAPNRCHSSS